MASADVVIVGAGVVGLSVGYHLLARDRSLRVIIVERESMPGTGSTAKATGGIRCQFENETLIRLSQRSVEEYRQFATITGVDVEFHPVGYLLFSVTPRGAQRLEAQAAVLRAHGVHVDNLATGEMALRWPHLHTADIRWASYTPGDGDASPYAAVSGYLQAFRSLNGTLLTAEEVVGITREANRVNGVRTAKRFIATPVVVNAAGVLAAAVGTLAGVYLPVRPYRRQVAVLTASAAIGQMPLIMDVDSGWYVHRQTDGTLLVGGTDKDTHPGMDEVVDPETTAQFIEIGLTRMPRLAEVALVRSYVGLRALTADDLPIIGPASDLQGFFCACGLAGHGFMHAPAVGAAMAQWILTGKADLPGLERCLPERFARTGDGMRLDS